MGELVTSYCEQFGDLLQDNQVNGIAVADLAIVSPSVWQRGPRRHMNCCCA